MAGLGRTLAIQAINSLIILFVILVIISAMFVYLNQKQLEAVVIEATQMFVRNLERNPNLTPEQKEQLAKAFEYNMRVRFGLIGSPVERIFNLMTRLITLDLGNARNAYLGASTSVKDQIVFALKNTIILFTTATIISTIIGILLGMSAARRAGSILDKAVSFAAILSSSIPFWWLGMLMLLAFSFKLGWFPYSAKDVYVAVARLQAMLQAGQLDKLTYFLKYLYTWAYYMALPLITVVILSIGSWAYVTRNIVLSKLTEDFVMTARAKGVPERKVLYGHVLRAASPPIVTIIALSMVSSLGGAIITETVFGWPGMGLLYWVSLSNGEAILLAANVYVTVLLFIIVVFALNFIYAILDPRVRTGAATYTPR
ncbi:MAG: ABC transporter permease [Fervidicoccaceae archaeon]